MNRLQQAVDTSSAVRFARRLAAQSVVCNTIAAILQPSVAYLGRSVPAETEHEGREAIDRVWVAARESALGRVLFGVGTRFARARRHSGVAAELAVLAGLERHRQLWLAGSVLLIGHVIAGMVTSLLGRPWPGPAILFWLVVVAAAILMILGARQLAAAWTAWQR